jgi:hypothetical protein
MSSSSTRCTTRSAMPESPALSFVLATDAYETIEPVVSVLRAQTVHSELEIVVVTTDPERVRAYVGLLDDFAAVHVVEIASLAPLSSARAAGVRAATAPIVYVGETHVFPEPGWAKALIEAHAGPWGAVVPGFGNANPVGALSWAAFLADYGAWLSVLPACEVTSAPTYNTAYKRAALLELEPLETMLTTGEGLIAGLRASGQRFAFEPAARVSHANVARPWHWVVERYLSGLLVAHSRMQDWSWGRRLAYAAASPLIPIVCLARVRHGVAAVRRTGAVSFDTYPALVAGAFISAAGELVGYLGGSVERGERRMTEYEIHKLRYLSSR